MQPSSNAVDEKRMSGQMMLTVSANVTLACQWVSMLDSHVASSLERASWLTILQLTVFSSKSVARRSS